MWRMVLALLLPVLFVGCVSPKTNYQPEILETLTTADTQIRTASPGQVVLSKARRKVNKALFVTQPTNILWGYTLTQGFYDKVGDDAKNEYFMPALGVPEAGKVDRAAIADPWKSIMAPRTGAELCIVTIFNGKICAPAKNFERRNRELPFTEGAEKQLVFRSVDGSLVLFDYREMKAGVGVPGAGKVISHDLASGRVVPFGALRLEVLGASNEFLTYRVLPGSNTN